MGKIHGKADLAADLGARGVLTRDQAESKAEAFAERILPAAKKLQLRPGKTCGIGDCTEYLCAHQESEWACGDGPSEQ